MSKTKFDDNIQSFKLTRSKLLGRTHHVFVDFLDNNTNVEINGIPVDECQIDAFVEEWLRFRQDYNGPTDKEMLDWLEKQNKKTQYTGKCTFRWSSNGRGWRLHETEDSFKRKVHDTVRAAITEAMMNE